MNRRPMWGAVGLPILLFCLSSCTGYRSDTTGFVGGLAGPNTTANPQVTLKQVSYSAGGVLVRNSQFGTVTVTGGSTTKIQFFNLVVDGVWRIRNVPILPFSGAPPITFFIDLGVPEGTLAPYPVVITSFDDQALSGPPLGKRALSRNKESSNDATLTTTEMDHERGIGAYIPNPPADPPAPATPPAGTMGSSTQVKVLDSVMLDNFPSLEQGLSECGPGAVANGVSYLNSRYNLGLSSSQVSVNEMKNAVGFDGTLASDGLPRGSEKADKMAELKTAYMASRKIGISASTLGNPDENFWNRVMDALRGGSVVELETGGHYQSVVGVSKLSDGSYTVYTADDLFQGKQGGTTILGYTATFHGQLRWHLTGTAPVKTLNYEGIIQTYVLGAVVQSQTVRSPSPSPSPPSPIKTDIAGDFTAKEYVMPDMTHLSAYVMQSLNSGIEITGYELLKENNPGFPFDQVTELSSSMLSGPNYDVITHFETVEIAADRLRWQRGIGARIPLDTKTYLDITTKSPLTPSNLTLHVLSKKGSDYSYNAGLVTVPQKP